MFALLTAGVASAQTPGVREPSEIPQGVFSDPRLAATAVQQVQRLLREGKNAEALSSLETALRQHPRDAQLRFLYGVLVSEAGRVDDAIAVFEQLTQDFPELPEPHNNLAVLLAGKGDLDRARVALEESIRALPGYALAQENLGDVYLRMALRAWESAGRLDPANQAAKEKLGLAREMLNRIQPLSSPKR